MIKGGSRGKLASSDYWGLLWFVQEVMLRYLQRRGGLVDMKLEISSLPGATQAGNLVNCRVGGRGPVCTTICICQCIQEINDFNQHTQPNKKIDKGARKTLILNRISRSIDWYQTFWADEVSRISWLTLSSLPSIPPPFILAGMSVYCHPSLGTQGLWSVIICANCCQLRWKPNTTLSLLRPLPIIKYPPPR